MLERVTNIAMGVEIDNGVRNDLGVPVDETHGGLRDATGLTRRAPAIESTMMNFASLGTGTSRAVIC